MSAGGSVEQSRPQPASTGTRSRRAPALPRCWTERCRRCSRWDLAGPGANRCVCPASPRSIGRGPRCSRSERGREQREHRQDAVPHGPPVARTVARGVESLAGHPSPAARLLLTAPAPAVSSTGHCGGTLMAKARTHFTCQSCGFQSAKWLGKCPDCGGWNTLVEEAAPSRTAGRRGAPRAARPEPVKLVDVEGEAEERRRTGIAELDRVLGGGVVPGSLVLLGGDPGIGKSTLLLSAVERLAADGPGALRLGRGVAPADQDARRAARGARASGCTSSPRPTRRRSSPPPSRSSPAALVVDSIQTMFLPELGSAPGTHQPGARGRRAADGVRQAHRACRPSSSAT